MPHFLVGLLLFVLTVPAVYAQHQSRWELGAGLGVVRTPDYRGASGQSVFAIPFPYIRYRGEKLRMDDEGVRSKIFDSDRLKIDLSVAGNLPVRKGNPAREGMPSLDTVGEIGPSLKYTLWREKAPRNRGIWFTLPARTVLSFGSPLVEYQGAVVAPFVDYWERFGYKNILFKGSVAIGPMWATRRYHDYFYRVSPKYATADRPGYEPTAGYSGSRITASITMRKDRLWIGAFVRYDNLRGAVFEDSPLVKTKDYVTSGIIMSWVFKRSAEKVDHPERF